jgi:alpha-1,3-rhamnosyl/mannosyltransferase
VVAYVSLYEGFGLPVVEALACRAVVVASATTAVPEAAGDAAILVDPARQDSIAEGLLTALNDEQLRARLRNAGPLHARSFTLDRFAESTTAAYRSAIG